MSRDEFIHRPRICAAKWGHVRRERTTTILVPWGEMSALRFHIYGVCPSKRVVKQHSAAEFAGNESWTYFIFTFIGLTNQYMCESNRNTYKNIDGNRLYNTIFRRPLSDDIAVTSSPNHAGFFPFRKRWSAATCSWNRGSHVMCEIPLLCEFNYVNMFINLHLNF